MPSMFTYYAVLFALAFLMAGVYVYKWQKHFDTNMTAIFILIPIVNLAYLLMADYATLDASMVALKVIYAGGCFLPWFSVMCVAELCNLNVSRRLRVLMFVLCALMFCTVLTVGHTDLFYKSAEIVTSGSGWMVVKEYGIMHTGFYILIFGFLAANIALLFYTLLRNKQVSRRILALLTVPIIVSMLSYLTNHFVENDGYELLPASYVVTLFVYLLIARRMALYNISETVIESMVQSGDTGFISVDFGDHYLGSNERAKKIIPALEELTVDRSIRGNKALDENLISWIDAIKRRGKATRDLYECRDPKNGKNDRIYLVEINYLYDGTKKIGYQVFLRDDTKNQKYIDLIDHYNSELQAEVDAKTERLVAMHNNLIMSMAAMVESRDNTTGGHIRRTSEGVRLLIEEMRRDPACRLEESFCRNIIKAAPMHDLGKIAVDDAILRKPGRYTDEEYEKMKIHAAEGARIVHEILKETDDLEFHLIAENVVHYHHERFDGSGYPDGLKGEEIPLEARIMAIADVYDALVSKRPYKEPFSFEQADRIVLEGMGTQFDPALRKYYEAARPGLEAFYSAQ